MGENREMYQEEILHLYNRPKNFGNITNATTSFHGVNASCGDNFHFDLVVEGEVIRDVKFRGVGCAISTASASLITEAVKGLRFEEVLKKDESFVLDLLKISLNPARMKCALLPLESIKEAVKSVKN